tara:strand:+ start:782 stop:1651 length:870 start_codon:yes stop_codon:yes gene_type:complete
VRVEVNMTILWLGDEDCHQVSRVGGKAANLSQLAASFRVPTGFCVTPELYKEWFAGTQDAGSPGRSVDADLSNIVSQEYRVMAERCGLSEPAVAVRSSALDEDGHNSSFAGQYDTYLNIKSPEAIEEAIVKCWDSAGGERMASYREEHGLSADSLGVSVLVQQLVPADVSGVVFSANPITGARDEVMINSTWGLGESLVSGMVTPDTLVVQKSDFRVEDSYIGEKAQMTVLAEGGTTEVEVPRAQRESQTLDGEKTQEVAPLSMDLEQHMGWPVDLEFAVHDNNLFPLQ